MDLNEFQIEISDSFQCDSKITFCMKSAFIHQYTESSDSKEPDTS